MTNILSKITLGLVALGAACSSEGTASTPPLDASSDAAPVLDAASPTDAPGPTDAANDVASCTAAKAALLKPIDAVSTGEVAILSDTGGVKTLFVDASAGGSAQAASNPRVYVDLTTGKRVDVTDLTAATSTAWDLALKRPILFTNGGDGGPGLGGAVLVAKSFDEVVAADANGKSFAGESFFESGCTPKLDSSGAVLTSFAGWYDYDQQTNALSPHAGTWIVKGASGKPFKLAITTYYATADGGVGQAGGKFVLKVGAL